jgi:SAM-dependent methyltransferase
MTKPSEFKSGADAYDRFMGRYSRPLAAALADAAGVTAGMRVVDVGCGPGGLTSELVSRLGPDAVAAVDPAAQFVEACRERNPGADVREGAAEELPWEDGEFDAALACLVIAFMTDADAGVAEMARVTKPGGTIAACMWDIEGGGMTMLRLFWSSMRTVRPDALGERGRVGIGPGQIAECFAKAGLRDVEDSSLTVSASYTDFDDFWTPFTTGVGPSGQALASLDPDDQAAVREACRQELPDGSFTLEAKAWFARGTV